MQTPVLRPLVLIGALAVAAALGACNGSDSVDASATPTAKAACGGATVANADMHCPPGFTQPKS